MKGVRIKKKEEVDLSLFADINRMEHQKYVEK